MRKSFQTDWHGIPFDEFSQPRAGDSAGAEFYTAFYSAFFSRFDSWEDLAPQWLATKRQVSDLLAVSIPERGRVLSIGCGVGAVERDLLQSRPDVILHVQDVSEVALRWLAQLLPPERIHIGDAPMCLPAGMRFDTIYMSSVEYCFDQPTLIRLLCGLRSSLRPGGSVVLLSSSCESAGGWSWVRHQAVALLERFGRHTSSWFWGWVRTRGEFRDAYRRAGLPYSDGFLEGGGYWIASVSNRSRIPPHRAPQFKDSDR